jgi:hypothetical protein
LEDPAPTKNPGIKTGAEDSQTKGSGMRAVFYQNVFVLGRGGLVKFNNDYMKNVIASRTKNPRPFSRGFPFQKKEYF